METFRPPSSSTAAPCDTATTWSEACSPDRRVLHRKCGSVSDSGSSFVGASDDVVAARPPVVSGWGVYPPRKSSKSTARLLEDDRFRDLHSDRPSLFFYGWARSDHGASSRQLVLSGAPFCPVEASTFQRVSYASSTEPKVSHWSQGDSRRRQRKA